MTSFTLSIFSTPSRTLMMTASSYPVSLPSGPRGRRAAALGAMLLAAACGGGGARQTTDTAGVVATTTPATVPPGAGPGAVPATAPASTADTATMTPDHRFLRSMSDHHQGLILMVHYVAEDRKSPGVLADARQLDRAQDAELDTMVTMLEKQYRDPYTPTVLPNNQAMLDSLKAIPGTGVAFDTTFLHMVIAHHREGVRMMDRAIPTLTDARVRTMAERMRRDQTREIAQFERQMRAMARGSAGHR